MLQFVHFQNFELILDILEHAKPSIFSLKQPSRLAAYYLEKIPMQLTIVYEMFNLQVVFVFCPLNSVKTI